MKYGDSIEDGIKDEEIKELMNALLLLTFRRNHSSVKHLILCVVETNLIDLASKSRKQELNLKRQLFCFLMYNLTRSTLIEISKLVKRDHSTMINSRKKVIDMCNTDTRYREDLRNKLKEMYGILTSKSFTTTTDARRIIEYNEETGRVDIQE